MVSKIFEVILNKEMSVCFFLILIMSFASPCWSENLFVRSGATGLNNGSDWNNAWTSFSRVVWGSDRGQLGAGDTLWIAGGTYADSIALRGGGTLGSPISLKRATASNSECTTSAGWKMIYDSQVVIDIGSSHNHSIYPDATRNYITIDGQVENGIKIKQYGGNASTRNCINSDYPITNWKIRHIEFSGPGGSGGFNFNGRVGAIDLTPASGSQSDVEVSHCNIHGFSTALYIWNLDNFVVEYCKIGDNISTNLAQHENILYIQGPSDNGIFRFNEVYNWAAEGIYHAGPWEGVRNGWKIYGNIFRDTKSTGRVFEVDLGKYGGGSVTNLSFYNNTIVNVWYGIRTVNSDQVLTGSAINNIFYDVRSTDWSQLSHDYNFSNNTLVNEKHGIKNGKNPFVNLAGKDFRIISTIGEAYPRGKGTPLDAEFIYDMRGYVRNTIQDWDIGAYAFNIEEGGTLPKIIETPTGVKITE